MDSTGYYGSLPHALCRFGGFYLSGSPLWLPESFYSVFTLFTEGWYLFIMMIYVLTMLETIMHMNTGKYPIMLYMNVSWGWSLMLQINVLLRLQYLYSFIYWGFEYFWYIFCWYTLVHDNCTEEKIYHCIYGQMGHSIYVLYFCLFYGRIYIWSSVTSLDMLWLNYFFVVLYLFYF